VFQPSSIQFTASADGTVSIGDMGPQDLKGFDDPVRVWRLER
jgi:class 3 adenylate cyclase